MSSAGRDESVPLIRATTLARLGCDSSTTGSSPASAPLGGRLHHARPHPRLRQPLRDVLGGGALAGTGVITGVSGVDPDQVAGQCRDLVLGAVLACAGRVFGHGNM